MSAAAINAQQQESRKERFEFVLTINDFIVCQRYFKIPNVKNLALHSVELHETLDYCVSLIQADLRNKTNLYNHYTAPQVFASKEEFETWNANPYHVLKNPTFVVFKDTEETFVYADRKLTPFEKRFNVSDYISTREGETQCDLKFTFLDNGKIIYSKAWDGNDYPRFIRNNIDLSNSKNRYVEDGKQFESSMIKLLIKDRNDLVPQIINEISDACSADPKDCTTELKYGDKVYHTNARDRYYKSLYKINFNKNNE